MNPEDQNQSGFRIVKRSIEESPQVDWGQLVKSIPTLTTNRLILRPFGEGDIERLHHIFGQKDMLRYFPSPDPPSKEKVERLLIKQLEHWGHHDCGWWAIEPRLPGPRMIGWSGLQYLPETGEFEVAYLLDRSFWGQGLATEAATEALAFGFERVGLKQIVAIVHPDNRASQRVIEKLGLAFVDEAFYFGMASYRYSLARSTWEQRGQ